MIISILAKFYQWRKNACYLLIKVMNALHTNKYGNMWGVHVDSRTHFWIILKIHVLLLGYLQVTKPFPQAACSSGAHAAFFCLHGRRTAYLPVGAELRRECRLTMAGSSGCQEHFSGSSWSLHGVSFLPSVVPGFQCLIL